MINCDQSKYNCGMVIPSSCVPYTGTDLTILAVPTDLACNANVNDVITLLDSALKTQIDSNNLTLLNIRCLTFNPATVTNAQLHQIEIDKICGLDASLTALTEQVNGLEIADLTLAIDLQCLSAGAAPCLTPPNIYTLLSVLNVMVSEICALKTAVGI